MRHWRTQVLDCGLEQHHSAAVEEKEEAWRGGEGRGRRRAGECAGGDSFSSHFIDFPMMPATPMMGGRGPASQRQSALPREGPMLGHVRRDLVSAACVSFLSVWNTYTKDR